MCTVINFLLHGFQLGYLIAVSGKEFSCNTVILSLFSHTAGLTTGFLAVDFIAGGFPATFPQTEIH